MLRSPAQPVEDRHVHGHQYRHKKAEAETAPEVARMLDAIGRESIRAALGEMLAEARSARLLDGDPAEMAEQFLALLWGDLMMNRLLQTAEAPGLPQIEQRAARAANAMLQLYSQPAG